MGSSAADGRLGTWALPGNAASLNTAWRRPSSIESPRFSLSVGGDSDTATTRGARNSEQRTVRYNKYSSSSSYSSTVRRPNSPSSHLFSILARPRRCDLHSAQRGAPLSVQYACTLHNSLCTANADAGLRYRYRGCIGGVQSTERSVVSASSPNHAAARAFLRASARTTKGHCSASIKRPSLPPALPPFQKAHEMPDAARDRPAAPRAPIKCAEGRPPVPASPPPLLQGTEGWTEGHNVRQGGAEDIQRERGGGDENISLVPAARRGGRRNAAPRAGRTTLWPGGRAAII
jgi:hypothetical protein